MDLKEFVTMSLTQIVQGVSESAAEISKLGGSVSPAFSGNGKADQLGVSMDGKGSPVYAVEFDVALVASTSLGGEAGAKLQIASFVNIGAKGTTTDKQESTSRVKFSVPIQLPTDPKSRAAAEEEKRKNDAMFEAGKPRGTSRF